MFRKEIAVRPLILWVLCAMTAPISQELAGKEPLLVGLVSAACTAIVCIGLSGNAQYGRIFSGLQYLWTAIAVGVIAQYAGDSWPMASGNKTVAIVLLAIAAWSSSKGPAVAARTAGILFVLLCVGYAFIFAAGIPQINGSWVVSQALGDWKRMPFLLLIPGAAVCLPRQMVGKRSLFLFAIPIIGVLTAWITCGNVHPDAAKESFVFYEMCRNLSFFGIAQRFEALACALVSIGWFSLLSLLLSCAGANAQKLWSGKGAQGSWIAATVATLMVLGKMSMPDTLLCVLGAVFWGLAPVLAQSIDLRKKCRKK